jgi:hypothetical protein
MIEYERVGGEKREEEGRRHRMTAILSHQGMEGSSFLLPSRTGLIEDERKRFDQ